MYWGNTTLSLFRNTDWLVQPWIKVQYIWNNIYIFLLYICYIFMRMWEEIWSVWNMTVYFYDQPFNDKIHFYMTARFFQLELLYVNGPGPCLLSKVSSTLQIVLHIQIMIIKHTHTHTHTDIYLCDTAMRSTCIDVIDFLLREGAWLDGRVSDWIGGCVIGGVRFAHPNLQSHLRTNSRTAGQWNQYKCFFKRLTALWLYLFQGFPLSGCGFDEHL